MPPQYDDVIKRHYDDVALAQGIDSSSTMTDTRIRDIETDSILTMIREYISRGSTRPEGIVILDVGCGNGYTLSKLREEFPHVSLHGLEPNESLRGLANSRGVCEVAAGDVRDLTTLTKLAPNVILSQRVVINVLDREDQRKAIENLTQAAPSGSLVIFVEAFASGLDTLNAARGEFNLDPILPAYHNLYLEDDVLDVRALVPTDLGVPRHQLSSHTYVSRVLHDVLLGSAGATFSRNSAFVSFLSQAIDTPIGNFSPIQFLSFIKA